MNKRRFLQALLGLGSATLAGGTRADTRKPITLQTSPVAGFQYYTGRKIWPEMKAGDRLTLYREPENRYDKRVVEVYWGEYKLGYIPKDENIAAAQLLDDGRTLSAKIEGLRESGDPWKRVAVRVWLVGV